MSHSTQPLLSGTIEADEEAPPVLSGNIGGAATSTPRASEPVVLVPGTAARDVEEGGIVSAAEHRSLNPVADDPGRHFEG